MYNVLFEFSTTTKPVNLVKFCINETCNEVRIGMKLSDVFLVENCLKVMFYHHYFSSFLLNMPSERTGKSVMKRNDEIHELLDYAVDVNILGGDMTITQGKKVLLKLVWRLV